jgi:hypothetical protein
MTVGLSRSFVIGRAVAADQWLRMHFETSLSQAPPESLGRYLETLEPDLREKTWRALVAWGDEMILRGTLERNPARALQQEIDLRDPGSRTPRRTAPQRAMRRAK